MRVEYRNVYQQVRNHLASLLLYVQRRFGRELLDQPASGGYDQEWSFEPVTDHKVALEVKVANGRAHKTAQGEKRHEIIVASALLGISSRESRDWIVTRMLGSSDSTMHSLARGLKRMWDPNKGGRNGVPERYLIACLVHSEIHAVRARGAGEDDICGRAVDIVLDHRLKAATPVESLALRKRLLEIYQENEERVQEIWLEMEAFELPEP